MNLIDKHVETAFNKYPEKSIFGVFLVGSQNYLTDTKDSDVDTKMLYIPTLKEITALNNPKSAEYEFDNGEKMVVKDIRLFFRQIAKQNINDLEVLFTDYFYINPRYKSFYEILLQNRENLAHYNQKLILEAAKGMAYSYLKKPKLNEKSLSQITRMEEFITRYIAGLPYNECVKSIRSPYHRELKNGEIQFTTSQLNVLIEYELRIINDLCKDVKFKQADSIYAFDNVMPCLQDLLVYSWR